MRIFVLEDDPTRIDTLFKELGSGHDWTIVDSCERVDKFQPPYDVILLDHDLGGRQLEDHEDNGAVFAELIKDKLVPDDVVIVHSYNPAGTQRILGTLNEYCDVFRMPFGSHLYWNSLERIDRGEW